MPLQLPCVPEFRKAFCCCSLRFGALTISWLSMLGTAMKFILLIILLTNLLGKFLNYEDEDNIMRTVGGMSSFVRGLNSGNQYLQIDPQIKKVSIMMATLFCLLETVITVMLLHGIHTEKPSQMVGYLLSSLFVLSVSVLSIFLLAFYMIAFNFKYGLLMLAISLFYSVTAMYPWGILYNYYRELEERKHGNTKYEIFPSEKKPYFAGL